MKRWKQNLKYGAAAVLMSALPALSFANDIDPSALTSGITAGKAVIIAVATAIFGLLGLIVAIRYGKRAAN